MSRNFLQYADKYPNIAFEFKDGVLLARLHTAGGPLVFAVPEGGVHAQLGLAFRDIAQDRNVKVLILTGTGDVFCQAGSAEGVSDEPAFFVRMHEEATAMLFALLEVGVPVIGAINGPATVHAELLVLSDIVIAVDTAVLADTVHFVNDVVPGDGVHVVWPLLLGPNRGRSFLLTGEQISAAEAKSLGIVYEIVPRAGLMNRAWELALSMARKPGLVLRNTKALLVRDIARRMREELSYGMTMEHWAWAAMRYEALKGS